MRTIDLVEAPEQVLRRAVDVVAARVVGEVITQWGAAELLPEEIDFVEEEDYACSHEPS
jgi:hypothetical protein